MSSQALGRHKDVSTLPDTVLVDMARHSDEQAVRALIQRHNQRLFRAARAILRSDSDAEDVVQASYVKAFTHLDGFRGDAAFSTWVTRIAMNDALGRVRTRHPNVGVEHIEKQQVQGGGEIINFPAGSPADPETEMGRTEIRTLLEQAVDELPPLFRAVFVLRDVEGLDAEETAAHLDIKPETVRTRLFRARRMLRISLERQARGSFSSLFPFDGARCVSMADRVVKDLQSESGHGVRCRT